jgi:hypothetical protein
MAQVEGMGDQELSAYSKIKSMCSQNVVLVLFYFSFQLDRDEDERCVSLTRSFTHHLVGWGHVPCSRQIEWRRLEGSP